MSRNKVPSRSIAVLIPPLLLPATATAQPRIIFVDQNATGGSNTGLTWADARLDLADGLADATSNNLPFPDEIWVAKGTYVPSSAGFSMPSGVLLFGGFSGNGTETSHDQADPATNVTTLDGNFGCDVVLLCTDSNPPFTLVKGFTIELANKNGILVDVSSNGSSSQPLLDTLVVTQNNPFFGDPTSMGGGLAITGGNGAFPTLRNCTFDSNGATGGGAIWIDQDCRLLATGCTFSGNVSKTPAPTTGGSPIAGTGGKGGQKGGQVD